MFIQHPPLSPPVTCDVNPLGRFNLFYNKYYNLSISFIFLFFLGGGTESLKLKKLLGVHRLKICHLAQFYFFSQVIYASLFVLKLFIISQCHCICF